MSKWKEYKLGDVCSKVTDGSHFSPKESVNGLPMFSVKDMKENSFDYSKTKRISEIDFKELIKQGCQPEVNDVLIAKDGSVLKHIFCVKEKPDYVLLSSIAILRPKVELVNPTFLSYNIKSNVSNILTNFLSGTGVPRIVLKDFKEIILNLPPLPTQKAIANTLSSLDAKIDLLHQQNQTFEQLAQTLFRQWFLEEKKDSWEEKSISDFGKIVCGKTPSKKISAYFNGNVPFIKIPDMHNKTFVFNAEDSLTEKGANSQLNKLLPPYSICVSCIATVGLVTMNVYPSQTNQQINSIIPNETFYRYFLFLFFKQMKDELLSMASGGTATDNLNTTDFSKIKISIPNKSTLIGFDKTVTPFFNKIKSNSLQIATLTQLRDTLLPKLMSGVVCVKEK